MAISVPVTPRIVNLAGNPMRFTVSSSGGTPTPGQESILDISVTAKDTTVDHVIAVTVMGVEKQFTLKATPEDPYDWPVATGGMTVSEWADAIQDRIERCYDIVNNYDITRVNDVITLTAKVQDTLYDIVVDEDNTTVTGIALTLTQGAPPSGGTVQGILMQVRKVTGNLLIGEDYKPVDVEGKAKFEISEYILAKILSDYSVVHFHLAKVSSSAVITYTDLVLKFRCGFAEKINNVYQPFFYDWYRYGIAGGLNRESLVKEVPTSGGMFYQTYWRHSFLTWAPNDRFVGMNEPVSLYYLFQAWDDEDHLKVMLTVTDSEDEETVVELKEFSSFPEFQIIEVLAGRTQLNVDQYVTGDAKSWKIWIGEGSSGDESLISEERVYYPDNRYFENERNFIFKNSFGVYDSLRCTGKFKTVLEHEREKVQLVLEDPETAYNAPVIASRIEEQQTFKASTGWLSATWLNYLRDFLRSDDIYEVDSSGNLYRCILSSKKTDLFEDKENNYALSFEYERAYSDAYYSEFVSHVDP